MTYRVDVLPAAEQDIADAVAWYDARSPQLGDRLLDELDATIAHTAHNGVVMPDEVAGDDVIPKVPVSGDVGQAACRRV